MTTASPSGQLARLLIEAYQAVECTGSPVRSFSVMFNPETYTTRHAVEYEDSEQAQGTTGLPQQYKATRPTDFSLTFTLDGTGAAADRIEVDDRVLEFLDTVKVYDGDVHRPPYLKIVWGRFLMRCVFKSADVKYTLFRPDGAALRAEITATFSGFVDDARRVAEEGSRSPDLTHRHRVQDGDTLPLLCHRYYGSIGPLVHVARFNRLADLMTLRTGDTLYFPPLDGDRGEGRRR